MNAPKPLLLALALAIIASGAGGVLWFKAHQRLGPPGVKTRPISGSRNLLVELPEKLPGYEARIMDQPKEVVAALPADTSYGRALYTGGDGFQIAANVVLMGTDRTSIHKPEFCLEGAGCRIEDRETVLIPMARPAPYQLPVRKFTASRMGRLNDGQVATIRTIYVFWFVAGDRLSADHSARMWEMGREMLRSGVLQRWAYVAVMAECLPGHEEATFDRMKRFIVQAVPQFQLVPAASPPPAAASSAPPH